MSILLLGMCLVIYITVINVTFVVDPKPLFRLGVPMGGDKA
jgi:hypothetical protein